MAELRSIPIVTPPSGDAKPASMVSVQQAIQILAENIHKLEGRIGGVALRDSLSVDGDITSDALSVSGNMTVGDSLLLTERDLEADGSTSPDLPDAGESLIYMDRTLNKLRVSENGGAFENLVKTATTTNTTPTWRVYNSAAIVISENTLTSLTFNSERNDPTGMHSTAVDTNKVTIASTGMYIMGFNVIWETPTVPTYFQVSLRINGTTTIALVSRGSNAVNDAIQLSTVYPLTAGDYVECRVYYLGNGTDTTLDILSVGNYSPEFWGYLIPATYLT
jgi:hypothetical protein